MATLPDPLHFPPLCDEAVLAIHDLLEEILLNFENRYFAQLRDAYYDSQPRHDPFSAQLSLPLHDEDPPF
jgi:hypothetical protein